MVVEKRRELSSHPQAHFINNRTMEIFSKMEGLADEIEKAQPPLDQWRRFVYCNTLAGPVFGTVNHLQPQGMLACSSWRSCLVIKYTAVVIQVMSD
ncbi:hypothetical protein R1flu_015017 [Riccia fluitans]|uniref:FAD-binding domain-containing protein n=1 Tax=Riccia fluitans TaxID=41844 RepID=A0ABD1YHQ8_9MARC